MSILRNFANIRLFGRVEDENGPGNNRFVSTGSDGRALLIPKNFEVLNNTPQPSIGNAGNYYIPRINEAGEAYEFQRWFEITEARKDALMHQPVTFFPYATLQVNIPVFGSYRIEMDQEYSINTTGSNYETHVRISQKPPTAPLIGRNIGTIPTTTNGSNNISIGNAEVIFVERRESQDSSGSGIVVPSTDGSNRNTGTDNIQSISRATKLIDIPAGQYTFILEYKGQNSNAEPTIYNAFLGVRRLLE